MTTTTTNIVTNKVLIYIAILVWIKGINMFYTFENRACCIKLDTIINSQGRNCMDYAVVLDHGLVWWRQKNKIVKQLIDFIKQF